MAETARAPAFDDLTARARIREAALEQFADHGFERTTIRGIAKAAGVSPGLVRHHFGSKLELRDAVDAHVVREIHQANDEAIAAGERGDFGSSGLNREALRPFQRYVVRALMDGSPAVANIFDQMVDMSEQWFAIADTNRVDPPTVDRRTRAAVFNAMVMGVPLMREHLSRILGVDTFSPAGDHLVGLALLDLYSHAVVTPDLAASARSLLDLPQSQSTPLFEESP